MNEDTQTGHNAPLPPAIHTEFWFTIDKAQGDIEKLVNELAPHERDFFILFAKDYRTIAAYIMLILRPHYPETFTNTQLSQLAHFMVSKGEEEVKRIETGYVPDMATEIPGLADTFITVPYVVFEEKFPGEDLHTLIA